MNVSTTYTWPNGYPNFPCFVRSDAISENTTIEIKTLTFDDISLASLGNLTLDVRARFVRPDKTVLTKDLISIDLSSKFSFSMKKGETPSVSCVRVDEKVSVGDAKDASLFQIGVTANLGQAFLSRVPHLISNFLITFAILKKLLANFLRNIAIFHSRLKVPHFLLEAPRVLTSCVKHR